MNFGLYIIITNPVLPHTRIAEICVRQNIKFLQLREKDMDDKTFSNIASDILSITKNSNTMFIINDRVNLCRLINADGVHIGQDDMPFHEAKSTLKKDAIIGVSTHNIEQAKTAIANNPTYIGFGPIYKTPTKKIPDPVVGCDLLTEVLNFSKIPVVAIGGIDEFNIHEVIKAGAKNICMVRALMNSFDFEDKLKKINDLINK